MIEKIIQNNESITIGRNEANVIRINDKETSSFHAMIKNQNGIITIFDNNSTNGTFVGSDRISNQVLKDGDVIKIGSVFIVFEQDKLKINNDKASLKGERPVQKQSNVVYDMKDGFCSIGRDTNNSVKIAHPSISPHHAIIKNQNGSFAIFDNNSESGTIVNGSKVTSYTLRDGDHIQIGALSLYYSNGKIFDTPQQAQKPQNFEQVQNQPFAKQNNYASQSKQSASQYNAQIESKPSVGQVQNQPFAKQNNYAFQSKQPVGQYNAQSEPKPKKKVGKIILWSAVGLVAAVLLAFVVQFIVWLNEPVTQEMSNTDTSQNTPTTVNDNSNNSTNDASNTNQTVTPASGPYEDDWTVLIYMNGSNLEYEGGEMYGAGSDDIDQMLKTHDSDKVNVLIETGGTEKWRNPQIKGGINQRFSVENKQLVSIMDLERRNMCAPETLIDFANWGISNYPANNYVLIFWDHGGGSLQGFGYDVFYDGDYLYLPEIEQAIDQITKKNQMKFEMVGFDACLMSTIETAQILAPYSNYFIASEETEPAHGWNYSYIMDVLDDASVNTGDKFGKEVVLSFIGEASSFGVDDTVTLSVTDLDKIDELVTELDGLLKVSLTDFETNSTMAYNALSAMARTMEFSNTDHYDIAGYAREMSEFYPIEANKVLMALDEAIIATGAGHGNSTAGGLSMYMPYEDVETYSIAKDLYIEVAASEQMKGYSDWMAGAIDESSQVSIEADYTLNYDVDPYEITLGADYYDNYVANLYINIYSIINENGEDYYVDLGYDVWTEDTDDPYTFVDSFSWWMGMFGWPVSVEVEYFDESIISYLCPISINGYDADMKVVYSFEEEAYYIDGYVLYRNEGQEDDFNLYSFSEGDMVALAYNVTNYEGSESEWLYTEEVKIDQGNFKIEEYELEEGAYAFQFVIEDYASNLIFTEMAEFNFSFID